MTAIFCVIDDILKEINPKEDKRRKVSDSEIVITALIAVQSFYGNHSSATKFFKQFELIPNMLDESRFNRRLHKLGGILFEIFEFISPCFKEICCEMEYIISSFPVKICKNIRISRSKIVKGKQWRGYTASMKSYFYGIKVQLITTKRGVPFAFHFTSGKVADVKALNKILDKFSPESSLYGDSAYTAYDLEDEFLEKYGAFLKTQRKKNSKRPDSK
nr:IS982 family transposase [Capnocytophaga cynodegmi]